MTQTPLDNLFAQRQRKADELRAMGVNPYANDFRRDILVQDFLARFAPLDKAALEGTPTQHALCGRVVAINSFGKAAFVRMVDGSSAAGRGDDEAGRLQLYIRRDGLSEDAWQVFKRLDLGDFIGVRGTPMRTKTGELSLSVEDFRLLTKALRPLP
ncbi:MAG: lysine--tRNA ligase, partial [Deltaproteobacteria bacterium]